MLERLSLMVVLAGLLGVLVNRDLIKKIISLDIMGTGVVSFFVIVSRKQGRMFRYHFIRVRPILFRRPLSSPR